MARTKTKKTPAAQLDLEAPSNLSEPKPVKEPDEAAQPATTETKTFRRTEGQTGRRRLFRDLREGEVV